MRYQPRRAHYYVNPAAFCASPSFYQPLVVGRRRAEALSVARADDVGCLFSHLFRSAAKLMCWMMGGFGGVDWQQRLANDCAHPGTDLDMLPVTRPLNNSTALKRGAAACRCGSGANLLVVATGWMVGVSVAWRGVVLSVWLFRTSCAYVEHNRSPGFTSPAARWPGLSPTTYY